MRSIASGATVVTIGPLTNLGVLGTVRPGALASASVVSMVGWMKLPASGLPAWGPDWDWNVQWDTRAAETVIAAALGRAYPGLPDDLVNFHYDPVTYAVAAGWPGAIMEKRQLRTVVTVGR